MSAGDQYREDGIPCCWAGPIKEVPMSTAFPDPLSHPLPEYLSCRPASGRPSQPSDLLQKITLPSMVSARQKV
jgi:hypothetical protein